MPSNFSRLQRSDWDRLGASALAREIFNLLNTEGIQIGEGTGEGTGDGGGGGGGSGNAFSGEVVSGSGETYQVELHTGETVTATVPGILSTEVVPAGTTGVVIQEDDNSYKLHIPLWVAQA